MGISAIVHNDLFYEGVDYKWDNDLWLETWILWKLYRKECGIKRWKYVPIGEQRTLTEIYNFSRGNVEEAIKLVEHAIAKGWTGVYLPDNWYRGGKNGIAVSFPRDWNEEFASKLSGQQLVDYRKFLRDECNLKAVYHKNGKVTKWVPKNQII